MIAGRRSTSKEQRLSSLSWCWFTRFICEYTYKNARILTDLASFVQSAPSPLKRPSHAAALSILLSPGLLIIDHIHFQYNGFLYGLLILSLVLARKESTTLASGLLFAALLCLKHIYLYLAPAY